MEETESKKNMLWNYLRILFPYKMPKTDLTKFNYMECYMQFDKLMKEFTVTNNSKWKVCLRAFYKDNLPEFAEKVYNDIKNVGNPMQNLFYITLETNWDASHGSPRDSYIVRLDNIGSYSTLSEKIKFNINNTAGKLVNGTINYQVLLSRNEVINIPIENNKKTLKLTPYSFSLYNYTLTEISYYNINYTQRNVIIGYKIE